MSGDEFTCPVCGAEVPGNALACPECGADEKTGWSRDTIYDDTGIEDPHEFDYEDWKRREVTKQGPKRTKKQWLWWVVGLFLLVVLFSVLLARRWCAIP